MNTANPRAIRGRLLTAIGLAIVVVVAATAFRNPGMQGINWSFPYFSGAANMAAPFDWSISPGEYESIKSYSVEEYRSYRHSAASPTVRNTYNNYGYVPIVALARVVFPWMGDADAVAALQVLAHVLIVLATIAMLSSVVERAAFFVVFGINPVILHVVTFPFYYFWTVVPSFFVAVAWFRGDRLRWSYGLMAVASYLAFLTRPATIFVILLAFGVAVWRARTAFPIAAAVLFAALCIVSPIRTGSAFWHTAYVGIGAYQNPYGIALADDSPYGHYKSAAGRAVETHPITGTFQDTEERRRYLDFLRERYMRILDGQPSLIVRNALFNFAESFGIGYSTRSMPLNVASGLIGIGMLCLIIWARQWLWGAGLLAYAVAFAPYYPPIPVYLFGGYFFTAIIFAQLMKRAWRGRSTPARIPASTVAG